MPCRHPTPWKYKKSTIHYYFWINFKGSVETSMCRKQTFNKMRHFWYIAIWKSEMTCLHVPVNAITNRFVMSPSLKERSHLAPLMTSSDLSNVASYLSGRGVEQRYVHCVLNIFPDFVVKLALFRVNVVTDVSHIYVYFLKLLLSTVFLQLWLGGHAQSQYALVPLYARQCTVLYVNCQFRNVTAITNSSLRQWHSANV